MHTWFSNNASAKGGATRHAVQGQVPSSERSHERRHYGKRYLTRDGSYIITKCSRIGVIWIIVFVRVFFSFWIKFCNLVYVSVKFQFSKESGHPVEECKLRVLYVPPPRPPSPVREGSEEGSSPRASVSDNGNPNSSDFVVSIWMDWDMYFINDLLLFIIVSSKWKVYIVIV